MFGDSIIWYLFLGGGGAGAAVVLAACDLLYNRRSQHPDTPRLAWTHELSRSMFSRGYVLSCAALVLGALCLLFDLGHPERFLYVLLYPTASVLTFGSYVLAATIACTAALAGIALFGGPRTSLTLVRTLEWAIVVLGLATAAYTGVLLAQIGFVPLWGNLLLPVLFACSSLSVGVVGAIGAALPEAPASPRLLRALARVDSSIVVAEAVVLVVYLASAALLQGQTRAVDAFLFGPSMWFFWIGFVACGLALPLALEFSYTRSNRVALVAAAVPLVLVGGYFLRYCIVQVPWV